MPPESSSESSTESPPESPSLEDLLVGAARSLRRTWGAGLEDVGGHDIAPHDVRALRVIGRHGPTRLGVIADHLRIAARSATDVVDRLEERGLVVRRPDPADRRAMLAELTDEGERVRGIADERRRDAAADFFGELTPRERTTLAELLTKLDRRHLQ